MFNSKELRPVIAAVWKSELQVLYGVVVKNVTLACVIIVDLVNETYFLIKILDDILLNYY